MPARVQVGYKVFGVAAHSCGLSLEQLSSPARYG
jgi:hypothetical protein